MSAPPEDAPRVWWSKLVRDADQIVGPARAVCWFLADVADKNGASWYGQKKIALHSGVTDRTVRNVLDDLVSKGVIRLDPPAEGHRCPTTTLVAAGLERWKGIPVRAESGSTKRGKGFHPKRKRIPADVETDSYEVSKKSPEEDPIEDPNEEHTVDDEPPNESDHMPTDHHGSRPTMDADPIDNDGATTPPSVPAVSSPWSLPDIIHREGVRTISLSVDHASGPDASAVTLCEVGEDGTFRVADDPRRAAGDASTLSGRPWCNARHIHIGMSLECRLPAGHDGQHIDEVKDYGWYGSERPATSEASASIATESGSLPLAFDAPPPLGARPLVGAPIADPLAGLSLDLRSRIAAGTGGRPETKRERTARLRAEAKAAAKAKASEADAAAWATCAQHWQTISGTVPRLSPTEGAGLSLTEAIARDGAAVVVRRFAYLAAGAGSWMRDRGAKITAVCRSAKSEWVVKTDREALDWECDRTASEALGASVGALTHPGAQNASERQTAPKQPVSWPDVLRDLGSDPDHHPDDGPLREHWPKVRQAIYTATKSAGDAWLTYCNADDRVRTHVQRLLSIRVAA